MITLVNNQGEAIAAIDPKSFPVKMPTETRWGNQVYVLHCNFTEDGKIKSFHVTKEEKK